MQVKLFFRTLRDEELEEKVSGVEIIRLKSLIQFKQLQGWSKPYEAIVDTGAPISLIPAQIWRKMEHIVLADHDVGGVTGHVMKVTIAKVEAALLDREGNRTPELQVLAYLAPTDRVPLIMGFKDLLDRFHTCFDYPSRDASIQGG